MLFYLKIQTLKNIFKKYFQIPDKLSVLKAFEDLVGNFTSSFIITIYYFVMSICLTVPSL